MVDFRRWITALAVIALMTGLAFANNTGPAINANTINGTGNANTINTGLTATPAVTLAPATPALTKSATAGNGGQATPAEIVAAFVNNNNSANATNRNGATNNPVNDNPLNVNTMNQNTANAFTPNGNANTTLPASITEAVARNGVINLAANAANNNGGNMGHTANTNPC